MAAIQAKTRLAIAERLSDVDMQKNAETDCAQTNVRAQASQIISC